MNKLPTFGDWLKQRRRALDLTQEELAARIGYSPRTIEKLESGERRASKQVIALLAEALNIPSDEYDSFQEFARIRRTSNQDGLSGLVDAAAPWRARSRHPNNLPAERTGFIGRESAIQAAQGLLLMPEVRLLTLTGPPGVGKTRLGLQLGARLLPTFRDGIYLVSLGSIHDPDMVIHAIARTLQVRGKPGVPVEQQLISYLKEKQLLLLLDNFEQVISTGPALANLLDHAPGLKALVTSRSKLHVYGEHEFPVETLAVPAQEDLDSVDSIMSCEAVRLFNARALAANPAFVIPSQNARDVANVCVRLDGLPLAIELAAAHTREFQPREILEKLDSRLSLLIGGPRDLPSRQQTMSAAIESSYELLDEDERRLFRQVSVFVGGFTPQGVTAVCIGAKQLEDSRTDFDPLQSLLSLEDKSLLRQEGPIDGEGRFEMLETIREYAWNKALECREGNVIFRHANYYLALAEEAATHLSGPEQVAWLDRLDMEHDNLRLALTTFIRHRDADGALKLGAALWRFWELHSYHREGLKWLERALAVGEDAPPELRGNAANAAGNLAWSGGDYETARRLHGQALALRRQTGDRLKIASSLNNLGLVAQDQGDQQRARTLYEESLTVCRELDEKADIASTLNNLGNVMQNLGDYGSARAMHRESWTIWREIGDQFGVALALNNMGETERHDGNYAVARDLYTESLETYRALGYKQGIAYVLQNMGHVAHRQGDLEGATSFFRECFNLYIELGNEQSIAKPLAGLAGVFSSRGDAEQAAILFGVAEALLEEASFQLYPLDQAEYDRDIAATRQALDAATFEAAMQEGRLMSRDLDSIASLIE